METEPLKENTPVSDGQIREGPWSCTYKEGNLLIKKYRYWVPSEAQREAKASQAVYGRGINTPLFYETRESESEISNVFEYVDIRSIDELEILKNERFRYQISLIINRLAEIPWNEPDDYWRTSLMQEFEFALSFLNTDINCNRYLHFLKDLTPAVFIHGDFTCQNMGITTTDDVVLFDFQHGSFGPRGWDKSYLASTFCPNQFFLPLSQEERMMAETISAIRYGRGIKKDTDDLSKREELYQLWHISNCL